MTTSELTATEFWDQMNNGWKGKLDLAATADLNALEEYREDDQPDREYWEKFPFRLKDVSWIDAVPEVDYLVPLRIHRTGLCQVYGEPYSGKTLFVLDLALSAAAGLPQWMEYELNIDGPQHVVYVANEGGSSFWIHVHAWLTAHPEADREIVRNHFHVLDGGEGDVLEMPYGTGRDQYQPALEDSLDRLLREVQELEIGIPDIMVFDTQVDLAPGIDENSNPLMVGLLRTIKLQADKNKFLAIVIHHTGLAGDHARGASGQRAKCDVQVQVRPIGRGTDKEVRWSLAKVKGAPQPDKDDGFQTVGVEGSKGAIARPITALQQAYAKNQDGKPTDVERDTILKAIRAGGTSARQIETMTGFDRKRQLNAFLKSLAFDQIIVNTGSETRPTWAVVEG